MENEGENPFQRSSKLIRSPKIDLAKNAAAVAETSSSDQDQADMQVDVQLEKLEEHLDATINKGREMLQQGSRKRANPSPEKQAEEKRIKETNVELALKKIVEEIALIKQQALVDHPKTFNGIKRMVERLNDDIIEFKELLGNGGNCTHDEDYIDQLRESYEEKSKTITEFSDENRKLRDKIKKLKDPSGVDSEIITELREENRKLRDRIDELESMLEREKHAMRPPALDKELSKIKRAEDVAKLVSLNWDKSCFRKTKTTVKSIQSLAPTRLVVASADNAKDQDVIRKLAAQYPALHEKFNNQPANRPIQIRLSEEIEIEEENSTPKTTPTQRRLVLIKTGSTSVADIAKALQTGINKLNITTEKEGTEKITLHITHAVDVTTALKLAECCLTVAGAAAEAELCAKGRKAKRNDDNDAETYVIINEEGKSYAEIVKAMKSQIDPAKQEVKIQNVSKTKDGHPAVRIRDGNAEARLRLQKDINEATGSTVEVRKAPRTQIIIHDLEETNTAEEILQRVREETEEPGEILVREPKESKSGAWTSTVTISKKSAQWLIKNRRIRIGWNSCRVTQKIYVPFCSNCATAGHTNHQCKETKSDGKRCYRCTNEGHEAAQCDQEATCNTCKVTGHQGISMDCPVYNKFMTEKLNGNKKSKEQEKNSKNDDDQSTSTKHQ